MKLEYLQEPEQYYPEPYERKPSRKKSKRKKTGGDLSRQPTLDLEVGTSGGSAGGSNGGHEDLGASPPMIDPLIEGTDANA